MVLGPSHPPPQHWDSGQGRCSQTNRWPSVEADNLARVGSDGDFGVRKRKVPQRPPDKGGDSMKKCVVVIGMVMTFIIPPAVATAGIAGPAAAASGVTCGKFKAKAGEDGGVSISECLPKN